MKPVEAAEWMTPHQYQTLGFVVLLVVATIVFDCWTYAARGNSTTISVVVAKLGRDMPVAVLALGVVLGHIFWPQRRDDGR